jgi:hypothetical protein
LNPATGAITKVVGPLLDATGNEYFLTGMDFRPANGVLYGSTANLSPTAPGALVTINPATGLVSGIGFFGTLSTMADLTFDPTTGILYGWQSAADHSLYRINLASGVATLVGPSGVSGVNGFGGGGLAANAAGTLYEAPTGANGDLYTINKTSGLATKVATLTGAPFPSGAIDAMAFSDGTLYAINIDRGNTFSADLVTINTTTGVITNRGTTAFGLDAIAFQAVPEPSSVVMLTLGLAGISGAVWHRRCAA